MKVEEGGFLALHLTLMAACGLPHAFSSAIHLGEGCRYTYSCLQACVRPSTWHQEGSKEETEGKMGGKRWRGVFPPLFRALSTCASPLILAKY